jgi:hypothetical protein
MSSNWPKAADLNYDQEKTVYDNRFPQHQQTEQQPVLSAQKEKRGSFSPLLDTANNEIPEIFPGRDGIDKSHRRQRETERVT